MANDKILNRIFTITERMVVFDSIDDVLDHILKTAANLTKSEAATIRAFDVRNGFLSTLGTYGLAEGINSQSNIPLENGVAGTVVKTGDSMIIKAEELETLCVPAELEGIDGVKTMLCVPMTLKESVMGCITVYRKTAGSYNEHDILLLRIFASEAVEAVEKARLLEELKRQAHIDSLTELFNKKSTLNHLNAEVARSQRYDFPLSVFFIDLDGFKQFNDQYGHLRGDKLLYDTGSIIRHHCRTSDIIGRFGGDEFVIIAPQTNEEGAKVLGERLCEAIAAHDFLPQVDKQAQQVMIMTCSIGISMMPNHGAEADLLLDKADQALYMSKRQGKNQAIIWKE